ncbi:MAG: V-type ATP synthase subunit E [Acutalibacteraceae bacterium]
MTGLDKIINRIAQDAIKSAEVIEKQGKQEAEEITEAALVEGRQKAIEIKEAADARYEDIINRAKSAAELEKRRKILTEKHNIIRKMIDQVHTDMLNMPDDEYFAYILKMVEKHVLSQKGEIAFSKADKKRLPQNFRIELEKASGGTLKLSRETRNIDGGFVLIYGGIEENCSFSAIFESVADELQDKIQEILFA